MGCQESRREKELAVPGLGESIRQILEIIEQEAGIVPKERIILGGLSQGCATAILTLLSSGLEIGAFIGWCGWLPLQGRSKNSMMDASETRATFLGTFR
jgi:predicted esterase